MFHVQIEKVHVEFQIESTVEQVRIRTALAKSKILPWAPQRTAAVVVPGGTDTPPWSFAVAVAAPWLNLTPCECRTLGYDETSNVNLLPVFVDTFKC